MSDLQTIPYLQSTIRMIEKDYEPWWVLRDVCEVLELSNPASVAGRLDEDEKGISQIYTLGGLQDVTIINEPGLYSVILRSDKAQAKDFKRWVTHVLLPSIRKTGRYIAPESEMLIAKASWQERYETRRGTQTMLYNGKRIRYVQFQGELWYSLADVGKANGRRNIYCTSKKIPENEKICIDVGSTNIGATLCINKAGLYRVLLNSTKPDALDLLDWILAQQPQERSRTYEQHT